MDVQLLIFQHVVGFKNTFLIKIAFILKERRGKHFLNFEHDIHFLIFFALFKISNRNGTNNMPHKQCKKSNSDYITETLLKLRENSFGTYLNFYVKNKEIQ